MYNNVVFSEILSMFGIPHADYDLAQYQKEGKDYILTLLPSFLNNGQEMLLLEDFLNYEKEDTYNHLNIVIQDLKIKFTESGNDEAKVEQLINDYLKMIFAAKFFNCFDLLEYNIGLIKQNDGNIISFSPMFDYEDSELDSDYSDCKIPKQNMDSSLKTFVKYYGENPEMKHFFENAKEQFSFEQVKHNLKEKKGITLPNEIEEVYKIFFE